MEAISEHLSQYQEMSLLEVLESYNHIELTEEESALALIEAKRKKERDLQRAEVEKRAAENRKMLTDSQWDVNQTFGFMKYRANNIFEGKFKLDDNNSIIFNLLCFYFSNDEMFVSSALSMGIENPSLDKGLMLAGNFGVGKTWLMKLFAKNQRQVFFVRNAKIIADSFSETGEDSQYLSLHKNPINDANTFFHKFSGLCIDDLGTEDLKTHYGNKKNVIGDLIEKKYSNQTTGIYLHATTNLTAEQMKEFYGGRVTSRMREIFNFIELPGDDRRL